MFTPALGKIMTETYREIYKALKEKNINLFYN
jgi:hypothetical protein